MHANICFGETHSGRCIHCDARTVLVSLGCHADVDQEPFESGEMAEDSPEARQGIEIPDYVEFGDEITGHYCLQCGSLTSLCLNSARRRPAQFSVETEMKLFEIRMRDRGFEVSTSIVKPLNAE